MQGVRATHWISPKGVDVVPVDSVAEPLAAFTLKDSRFQIAKVGYGSGGAFTIEVPTGAEYYVGSLNFYFVTRSRSIDLGLNRQGRKGQVNLDGGTPTLTITATGLSPWQAEDALILSSESVFELALLSPAINVPTQATALTKASFDYVSTLNPTGIAFDATRGDTAVVQQIRTTQLLPDGGSNNYCQSVIASASTGAITTAENRDTPLSLTMTAAAAKTISFDLRSSAWAALAPSIHPQARFNGIYFEVNAVSGNLDRGWLGYLSSLVSCSSQDLPDGVYPATYGNPSAGWAEVGSASANFLVPVQLPDAGAGNLNVYSTSFDLPSVVFGGPLTPAMSPPQQLVIDGQPAQGAPFAVTSQTPLVSWSAPASGTPTSYVVTFRLLFVDANNRTRTRRVGGVQTTQTQVRVPPGVLATGTYAITLTASNASGGGFSIDSSPSYDAARSQDTQAASSQFTVP